MKNKKILLLCVTSQNVYTFRRGLINELQQNGYDVSVVAFDEDYRSEIENFGVDFYCIQDNNRTTNLFKILSLKKKYRELIRQICPDIVFTFMLKPNTFGVMAAKQEGIENIYSMVEGAGDVFINNSLKWKIIRFVVCRLYRNSFQYAKKVFFLNYDDQNEFIERKLVNATQCEIIHGVGINLEHFAYKPLKNTKNFLMIARMLKTKGIFEYCECARIVKKQYPDAVFHYLGAEGTVTLNDIQEYIDDGSIQYLGTTKDVRPYLEECTVFVLPSYREGFGLVNAEAGAIGRVVITGNTIGTKDTVKNGYNGFLIPIKNANKIAEKCFYFIKYPEEAIQMGVNNRKFVEKHFDQQIINEKIIKIIENKRETANIK